MILYDAGVCPRCKSKWTGRIIIKRSSAVAFSLMGPAIYSTNPKGCNFACAECGVMWIAPPKMKWVPVKEYFALRKEWSETIDPSPVYSREEEAEISRSMYVELTGEDGWPKRGHFTLARKILSAEKNSLGKQIGNTVSDFAGIAGINLYKESGDDPKETDNNTDEA